MRKILLFLTSIISLSLYSQGCSDAGFCSIAPTSPISNNYVPSQKTNTLRWGASYGKAENSINAYNVFIEYTRRVNANVSFHTRFNFLSHTGNDIQTGEIGDVYFTGDFKIAPKMRTTVGFKIPLKQGDKIKKGVVLPMDYQPSLGTLDFLWAMHTQIEKWNLSAGIEVPLTQNQNRFFSNNFIATEDFQTTNQYRRNPDAWLRISYPISYQKLVIIPSLLPIYHLGNDSYVDAFGERKTISKSCGWTINAGIQLDYKLCENNILGFNVAAPFVTRDSKPDGLARKYVITLDYRTSF